jgi:hypothetical protein
MRYRDFRVGVGTECEVVFSVLLLAGLDVSVVLSVHVLDVGIVGGGVCRREPRLLGSELEVMLAKLVFRVLVQHRRRYPSSLKPGLRLRLHHMTELIIT